MVHLCDANVFIAVALEQHGSHHLAAAWFSDLAQEDTAAFCRATQTSFLRLLTQKIAPNYSPLTNRNAWAVHDRLCKDDAVVFEREPEGLEPIWRKLARPATASPKIWMDAYLAAFAIAGGFRMTTLDRDFKSFETNGLDLLILEPGFLTAAVRNPPVGLRRERLPSFLLRVSPEQGAAAPRRSLRAKCISP